MSVTTISTSFGNFLRKESTLRGLSGKVASFLCAPDVIGYLQLCEQCCELFPPWTEQESKSESDELESLVKLPDGTRLVDVHSTDQTFVDNTFAM